MAGFSVRAAATSGSSTPTNPVPSVGKLFTHLHGLSDHYNCTEGLRKWAFAYFVPGYDKSAANPEPYGRWKVKGAYDGPGDLEVLVMDDNGGKNVQDVAGGRNYQVNVRVGGRVSVVGYPSDGHGRPFSCGAEATVHAWQGHPDEWQADCGKNFNDGVSGSPYMIDYDPRAQQGTVVAVLGGDHQGSVGAGGQFSLGDPLTPDFETFLQDVLKNHT